MKTLTRQLFFIMTILLIAPLYLMSKATEDNLGLIINMDDVLATTPAQQAVANLQTIISGPNRAHPASKTQIFQQTLLKYVRDIYNKSGYEKELSQNADHMVQFFELCKEISLPPATAYICVRLFNNKLKSAEVVDDTVLVHLLGNIPQLVDHYFAEEETDSYAYDLDMIKKQINSIIIKKLTPHTGVGAKLLYPTNFSSELSHELSNIYKKEFKRVEKDLNKRQEIERLRSLLIRFFETIINKAMWEPENDYPWRSFHAIAEGIGTLAEYGIVDHMDDLDDLYWSLTHRFCYFLELAGGALSPETFERIEQDLDGRHLSFLEFKEQDEEIVSKKETLVRALAQAKIRALAFTKNGLRTNPLQKDLEAQQH